MPLLNAGHDVLLVAHAHVLRILTSQWLDVDPHFARLLRLDTAHYCVLSQYKGRQRYRALELLGALRWAERR